MARGKAATPSAPLGVPMLKSIEEMSQRSGIGINKLREMISRREIEFIRNGNRILLADRAIWDWYNRNCIRPETGKEQV